MLFAKCQRLNRWRLRITQAFCNSLAGVWDNRCTVNGRASAMGSKARPVWVQFGSNVSVPPQYLDVRRTPYAVDVIEIWGDSDVSENQGIICVELLQVKMIAKIRVSKNVRSHKDPLWVSTVICDRWDNSDLHGAECATVNDPLSI